MDERELKVRLKRLLAEQLYGVLATTNDAGEPHTSIVAFASADDLRSIVYVTPRDTRKFRNTTTRPQVALFIDDRRGPVEELMQVTGVEARGAAELVEPSADGLYRELYLAKYPAMREFVDAPANAIVKIAVERYEVVERFQHVMVLEPADE